MGVVLQMAMLDMVMFTCQNIDEVYDKDNCFGLEMGPYSV